MREAEQRENIERERERMRERKDMILARESRKSENIHRVKDIQVEL